MATKVQICNVALSAYLGAGRITSITEDSTAAIQCNLHFDDIVLDLFETHWWDFATGRQLLAEKATNDRSAEWAYAYQKPADSVAIRWVNHAETARGLIGRGESPDVIRETTLDTIYCDVAGATCEFTKNLTDTALYPQYFANAISAYLAAAVALPITKNMELARNAQRMAYDQLGKAIALDERQQGKREDQVPEYLKLRGV